MSQSEDHPSKLILTRTLEAWPGTLCRRLALVPVARVLLPPLLDGRGVPAPILVAPVDHVAAFSRDHHDGPVPANHVAGSDPLLVKDDPDLAIGSSPPLSCSIRVDDARLGRSVR